MGWNRAVMENRITDWINSDEGRSNFRSVITIPVVVHVLYHTNEENIPDEQIHSQIAILNDDFRALNTDINNVPSTFQNLIADTEIAFCLAAVDPDGNPTTGINRKYTNNPVGLGGTTNIHYSSMGGQDAWDPEHYLNIWVAKFAGGIGGISSFPGIGPAAEDGVEINYRQFGNINVEPPFHLGRTLTHEIGHYLNLEHPWGPELNDCCEDDFVDDTPASCETYIGQCPVHPVISCSQPDLFMNFMFYSNDACLNMFTIGQKIRMMATLNTLRQGLVNNGRCEFVNTENEDKKSKVKILGNPIDDVLKFEIMGDYLIGGKIKILDLNGRVLFSKNIENIGLQQVRGNQFAKGIYFLSVEKNGEIWTEKIVVN